MHSITLRFLAHETSQPHTGRVPGGAVARWMDDAGHACATAWSQGACATTVLGHSEFLRSVRPGELVEVHARLTQTEGSQLSVLVEVRSGALDGTPLQDVVHCAAVYTAIGADDTARTVDKWTPETPGDMALAQRVQTLLNAARPTP